MTNDILIQLALNTTLLPDSIRDAIRAGAMPPIEEIVMALLTVAFDCAAATASQMKPEWNDRRLARQGLANAFLTALLVATSPSRNDSGQTEA